MRYTDGMTNALHLTKEYVVWHYGAAIREMTDIEKNFLWFGYHFFSIPLLTRTLFSPIYRLRDTEARLPDIAGILQDFIITAVMRLVGFFVKIAVLAMGFLFETVLIILFVPALALWLILPLVAALLVVADIGFLFITSPFMRSHSADIWKNKFAPALAVERIFPGQARRIAGHISAGIVAAALILPALRALQELLWLLPADWTPLTDATRALFDRLLPIFFQESRDYQEIFLAIILGAISLRGIIGMLDCFVNSKTSRREGDAASEHIIGRFNLAAAELWHRGIIRARNPGAHTLLSSLSETTAGKIALMRLGIANRDWTLFIKEAKAASSDIPSAEQLLQILGGAMSPGREITLADILSALFDAHKGAREFFMRRSLSRETLRGAAKWAEQELARRDTARRWWSREYLGRIPGLAKGLSYGQTPFLEKFSHDAQEEPRTAAGDLVGRERHIRLIESALLRQSGANVMIVGEPGTGKKALLLGLADMIRTGKIFPELEHKRVLLFSTASLIAAGKTKGEVESLLIRIFNEAARAGNIILAIRDFPEFIQSLSALGVSAVEILSPYLSSPALHVVALGNAISSRRILENETGIMEHFEKIELEELSGEALMDTLKNHASEMEVKRGNKTILTYPALEKIAECAEQNLVEGGMPRRAITLMEEVMEEAAVRKARVIFPELVMALVARKTRMPLGKIAGEERERLLHLEEFLRQRVIGQDEAVGAVANAIRRSRSGIRNPKRPIGTFLFMGPTGVGKTETAKAIAAAYFGNEDAMARYDCTEYHASESVDRLIGSFARNEPGILASAMRSSPYGVVLLDEFEKAHLAVRNLFLQILDEGFFSDYLGERVNMRNTIIVATSNAGSAMIARLVSEQMDHAALASRVIAAVQQDGIMSPELLNRFDSVVIFRPLARETRRAIARLMLDALARRLKKQNIEFFVTDEIADAVADGGYDPAFGARPMQRFIQDRIEKTIAEKIIRGDIKPGEAFSFSTSDIAATKR